jgi:hypothetical protein
MSHCELVLATAAHLKCAVLYDVKALAGPSINARVRVALLSNNSGVCNTRVFGRSAQDTAHVTLAASVVHPSP